MAFCVSKSWRRIKVLLMSLGYDKCTTWWYFKRLSNVIEENSPLLIIVDRISRYCEPSCVSADCTWKWHMLMRDRSVRLLPMSWQISLWKISELRILGNVCRPVWHALGQRKIYSYSKLFKVRVNGNGLSIIIILNRNFCTLVTYRESVTLKNEVLTWRYQLCGFV